MCRNCMNRREFIGLTTTGIAGGMLGLSSPAFAARGVENDIDVFDGRIKRSRWILLKYSIDFETAGVALAKERPYRTFVKYSFPSYIRALSFSKAKRAMLKKIGRKIGRITHTSAKDSLDYLPLLKEAARKNEEQTADLYRFTEDEIAFISERPKRRTRRSAKS